MQAIAIDKAVIPPGCVSVRIVDDLAGMDAIGTHWLALEERCKNSLTFFQSFAWCRSWIEAFASDTTRPLIHTVWRHETLVAVWPLMTTVGPSGFRKLETLGRPHAQYCDIICDPDRMDNAAASALAGALPQDCDVAEFTAVPETSWLTEVLADYPLLAGYSSRTSILDLSPFGSSAGYAAHLAKRQRHNRTRRRNHLVRLGNLGFAVIWPDHPEFAELVSRCIEMKRVWLANSGRHSVGLAMEGHTEFLARFQGDSERLSGACVSVLRVDDDVVALEVGFIRNRHYYSYLGAFEWELRKYSPGKVQMDLTIGWLIDNGIDAYDLLGNSEDYKVSWTNRAVRLRAYAKPYSLKGRIYLGAWLPVIRPALKRLYGISPKFVRRLCAGHQSLVSYAFAPRWTGKPPPGPTTATTLSRLSSASRTSRSRPAA